jgi:hypothetical protein
LNASPLFGNVSWKILRRYLELYQERPCGTTASNCPSSVIICWAGKFHRLLLTWIIFEVPVHTAQ